MATPGTPRRRNRDDVAEMALHLLDEYGLPDLTMRHLATALGVQPSALYWHYPSKQALLAAVSTRILAPLAGTPVQDLSMHEAVCVLGTRLRECLLAYRDASKLVSSSLALGLVDSPVQPQLREVARLRGVPIPLADVATEVVVHFVVGYVFHEQQRQTADSLGLLDGPEGLRPEAAIAGPSDGTGFAGALRMIADGLGVSVAQSSGPRGAEGITS